MSSDQISPEMSLAQLQREMVAAVMMPLTANEDMRASLPMAVAWTQWQLRLLPLTAC